MSPIAINVTWIAVWILLLVGIIAAGTAVAERRHDQADNDSGDDDLDQWYRDLWWAR